MRKTSFTFLLAVNLSISTQTVWADQTNFWPSLESDKDKVKLMLWTREIAVPNLFQGMTEYDVDYFDVLNQQHRINTELANRDDLRELLTKRPDPVEVHVEVRVRGASRPAPPSYDQHQLDSFGKEMQRVLSELPPEQRTFEGLRDAIQKTTAIRRDIHVRNVVTMLINTLPNDRRKSVFPLSLDEKREIFRKELTQERIERGLKTKDRELFGIQTPEDVDHLLRTLIRRDNDLEALYGLATIAVQHAPAARGPLEPDLAKLGLEQAALIGNSVNTVKELEKFLPPYLAKSGSEALSNPRKLFTRAVVSDENIEKHTLTEMPVDISWASSCPGGDCITKNMFAYNNVPSDRRFFVDLGKDGARGFIDVQTVEVNGKKYLLAQMVQGQRLSPDLVETLLRGLEQKATELGAEGLMLPTWDQLSSHTNYHHIRDRLRSFVSGREETHYMFTDNNLREALRPYVNDASYNTQASRNKGVIIDFGLHPSSHDVSAQIGQAPTFPYYEAKISPGEVYLTTFEIEEGSRNPAMAYRFLDSLGMSKEQYQATKPVLANERHQLTEDYLHSVAKKLKEYGYDFDATLKRSRLESLYSGFLRAPDAWSAKWQKHALDASYDLLQRSGTVPLVRESTGSESAREFDLAKRADIRAALLKDLDGKYINRRAAAGILVSFGEDYDKALPTLFGLAHESSQSGNGLDEAVTQIFHTAQERHPERFRKVVLDALHSQYDWIQRGALIAVDVTHLSGNDITAQVASLSHGYARSHEAYQHSNWLTKSIAERCSALNTLQQIIKSH